MLRIFEVEQEILVPDIGDYSNVEVIEVTIKEGDHLKKDATMITLETDKATMDIPAPMGIKISKVHVKPGDRVSKGSLIASVTSMDLLDATELGRKVGRSTATSSNLSSQLNQTVHSSQITQTTKNHEVAANSRFSREMLPEHLSGMGLRGLANANPSVRKFAREVGVNLDKVVGTNQHGRISEDDVKKYINQLINQQIHEPKDPNSSNSASTNKNIALDFNKWGETKEQPLSRIKKRSGQHLHKNWLTIPHVTHFENADITELEQYRRSQQGSPNAQDLKITLLVFLIKAVVNALKAFPNFNSSLANDGENLIIKKYYNVGIAVDTEGGLVVPVVKNAEQKDIFELAKELGYLSQKARDNKLSSEDMQGGSFTISSLGGIGGYGFTPIINAPEVAILGVSRHRLTPVYLNKELHARLMLPLALSYDHRVIDGAEAAKFSKFIVAQLEDLKNFYV